MTDKVLADRGQALETEFFKKQNELALQKLKAQHAQEVDKEGISHLTGVNDPAVLNSLVQLKLKPETFAAFGLYPLVEVAWADGGCDEKERSAVLQAAEASGVAKSGPAYAMLDGWLLEQPPKAMRAAWFSYVKALCEKLTAAEKAKLKAQVMGRALAVAQKSGGILGIMAVTKSELAILKQLEDAFL